MAQVRVFAYRRACSELTSYSDVDLLPRPAKGSLVHASLRTLLHRMDHSETQLQKVYGVFFVEFANTALDIEIMFQLMVLEYGERNRWLSKSFF